MKKIIVTLPKKNGNKWKGTFNGRAFRRKNAELIYKGIERKLLASSGHIKTAAILKNDGIVLNESCVSSRSSYLLWILICFLEEKINLSFLKLKEQLYKEEFP